MRVVISSGHGKYVRGACGFIDEVDEARLVVERVAELLRRTGADVVTFHDDSSTSQDQNLNTIVNFHNGQGDHDLDVSVHFNAYQTTDKPMGTEVLYVTQDELAAEVSAALAEAGDFLDRGPKYRGDLFFLNSTEAPSILIETCFVDSAEDTDRYRMYFNDVCLAIAETIAGHEITAIEPPDPVEPPELPPPEYTEENRVDVRCAALGEVTVVLNGEVVHGGPRWHHTVLLQVRTVGDVVLTINGEDFHSAKPIPENQCNITATVFGGGGDRNYSAYPPYDEHGNGEVLDDDSFYVALPDRIEGDRPTVRVYNRATGQVAEADIMDVGPWNTDDPYWAKGTRPQAESGTDMTGRPTNKAGIDLSPALSTALGIDGMGHVDWEFVGP